MSLSLKHLNTQNEIEQMLMTEPLASCTNWLYHHPKLLAQNNVITGEKATDEIKHVAINNVAKGKYISAINDICRLNDIKMHINGFYDEDTYENISAQQLADKITNTFTHN